MNENDGISPELKARRQRVVLDTAMEATEFALAKVTKSYQGIIEQIKEEETSEFAAPRPPEEEVRRQFENAWYQGLHGFLLNRFERQAAMRGAGPIEVRKDFEVSSKNLSQAEIDILEKGRMLALENTAFQVLNIADRNKKTLLEGTDHFVQALVEAEGRNDEFSAESRIKEISEPLKARIHELYSEAYNIVLPKPQDRPKI